MRVLKLMTAVVFVICVASHAYAQTTDGLIAHYSFDDCDVTDETGISPDGDVNGNPECGCGPVGNALIFDGVDDWVGFFNERTDLLSKDFTASFYIAPANISGTVDIFSKRKLCTPDSAVAVRYEPDTRKLRAILTEGVSERAEVAATLEEGQCWYHITWVRSAQEMLLYVDGQLASAEGFDDRVDARNTGTFSIANSPCLANGEMRFAGGMDEFRVYNRALSPDEVLELYTPIDRLITMDTVLFLGTGVQISITNSCANAYLWTPQDGVVMPDDPEPFITPPITTTYGVIMDYGFCQTVESIMIIVVDSTELDCDDVFLPNAFTPNLDGLNDDYGMSNANFFLGEFQTMDIFDRLGSKIYSGFTPFDTWDGTINGKDALPGIYIYKVRYRCNDEDKISTGSFNLLR